VYCQRVARILVLAIDLARAVSGDALDLAGVVVLAGHALSLGVHVGSDFGVFLVVGQGSAAG